MGVNCNYIISNGLRTNKWQGEKKPFFEFVRLWYLGFESVRLMELGFAVWSTPCSRSGMPSKEGCGPKNSNNATKREDNESMVDSLPGS